jgi:hypothetical protein
VCAGNGGAIWKGDGDDVARNGDVFKVVGDLKEVACGTGVDKCGGVERQGWGRLCGCNNTPSNFYIISSRHKFGLSFGSGST